MSPARAPLAIAAILWIACAPEARPPPRHLVLVTLDTLRQDRLGAYGYERDTSPHLDALAARGVRFDDAIAQAIATPPSHASILTGLNPPRHGLRRLVGERLAGAHTTLAEILRDAGFATAAFVGSTVIARRTGLDQGFDVYDDAIARTRGRASRAARSGIQTNERVRAWLESRPAGRVFLWVHYFEPHWPYFPPEAYRLRFHEEPVTRADLARTRNANPLTGSPAAAPEEAVPLMSDLYDAEVRAVDDAVGELFALLAAEDVLADAVVAVVADHGECLGERGYYFGHFDVYDPTAVVPMIVAHPDARYGGRVVTSPVATVDLMPTLLAWLGLDVPRDLDGIDLTPVIEGLADPSRALYTEQMAYFETSSARTAEWLLLDHPSRHRSVHSLELVERRSGREVPLAERPEVVASLEHALQALWDPRDAVRAEAGEVDDEVVRRLRAIGYEVGEVDAPAE